MTIHLWMSRSIPALFAKFAWTKTAAFTNVCRRFCAHDILVFFLVRKLFACSSSMWTSHMYTRYTRHSRELRANYSRTAREQFMAQFVGKRSEIKHLRMLEVAIFLTFASFAKRSRVPWKQAFTERLTKLANVLRTFPAARECFAHFSRIKSEYWT